MVKRVVVFHHDDNDGCCAAWVVKHYYDVTEQNAQVITVPVQYGKEIPFQHLTSETILYIVDFSYKREALLTIKKMVKEIHVFDHHATAKAELEDLDFANRFLSFYLLGYENYRPDMDTYLTNGLKELRNDKILIDKIKKDFKNAMDLAYFIFDKGQVITSWSYDELKEQYPDKNPQNYTFIPSSLSDNKYLGQEYADALAANDAANYETLFKGNWFYRPPSNGFWTRDTLKVVDKEPLGCSYYRCYDKASSRVAEDGGDSKQKDPDYTASLMGAKDKEGNIYILGNYIRDGEGNQLGRYRENHGPRDQLIERQAMLDGCDVVQYLPQDPAAAGKVEYQESAKKLQKLGIIVKPDPNPSNKSKKTRFLPFCSACYNGQIYFVKNTFDPDFWDYLLLELENFDGNKNSGYHDDLADCISMVYAVGVNHKTYQIPAILPINAPTSISGLSPVY